MFGLGMGEVVVIAIVALLVLGPDKLPDAAKTLAKTIRGVRSQTRELTDSLERHPQIGGAVRELRSVMRGGRRGWRLPPVRLPGQTSSDRAKRGDEPAVRDQIEASEGANGGDAATPAAGPEAPSRKKIAGAVSTDPNLDERA